MSSPGPVLPSQPGNRGNLPGGDSDTRYRFGVKIWSITCVSINIVISVHYGGRSHKCIVLEKLVIDDVTSNAVLDLKCTGFLLLEYCGY